MKIWAVILGIMIIIGGVIYNFINQIPLLGYAIPDGCGWIIIFIGIILFILGLLVP